MKQKKSKYRWSLWLTAVLFFVGIASILYPSVSNLISLITAKTTIKSYNEDIQNMTEEDLSSLFQKANQFNIDLFNGKIDYENAKCLNRKDNVMCYLDIPCINVYLPVYYGTSKEVLEKGCGYLENTSLPVGGKNTHSVISGHTGLPSAEMLTNLDKAKLGDVFYIHISGEILAYKIDDIHAVRPDEVDYLRIVEGKDYLTLLTCTPYGINDKRLLVRGTRILYTPEEIIKNFPKELPKSENDIDWNVINQAIIIVVIAFAAISMFVSAVTIIHITRKRYEKNKEISKYTDNIRKDKDLK